MAGDQSIAQDSCAAPDLIPVDEAMARILEAAVRVAETEVVATRAALGRVLAEDVVSAIDVPGYDNSAMDGFAVNSADCGDAGAVLTVSQRIPAGQSGTRLQAGTAARIFTCAPVPEGREISTIYAQVVLW